MNREESKEENIKYLLVKTDTYFVDGHGSHDLGGTSLEVVKYDPEDETSKWYGIEADVVYDQWIVEMGDDDIDNDETGWIQAKGKEMEYINQDGYNCTCTLITAKEINAFEYNYAVLTLKDYNHLLNKF